MIDSMSVGGALGEGPSGQLGVVPDQNAEMVVVQDEFEMVRFPLYPGDGSPAQRLEQPAILVLNDGPGFLISSHNSSKGEAYSVQPRRFIRSK